MIGPAPNFISDIFYLTSAVNHYGLNRTLQSFDDLYKQADELQRHIDLLTSSMSPLRPGVSCTTILVTTFPNHSLIVQDPLMIRTQAGIDAAKVT